MDGEVNPRERTRSKRLLINIFKIRTQNGTGESKRAYLVTRANGVSKFVLSGNSHRGLFGQNGLIVKYCLHNWCGGLGSKGQKGGKLGRSGYAKAAIISGILVMIHQLKPQS